MILKLVRTPGLYLVGFMGSGKSTVGRVLADRLGWTFCDVDESIETAEHHTIPEIFEQYGEERFRQIETEAVRTCVYRVRAGCPTVAALGGGAFVREENYDLLEDHGVTIWLDCPLDIVRKRLEGCQHRPLARDPDKLIELYKTRRAGYARADYRVEIVSDDAAVTADAIEALPIF